MFFRYSLRTTDVDAARAFYATALGLELPAGASSSSLLDAWPLHEQARARGAPAHWLGHLAVADVDAMVSQLLERGGERLGPTVRAPDGARFATLRDPAGAVVAVREASSPFSGAPIAWHQLHTEDADQSWAMYAALFGWSLVGIVDVADPVGGHRLFAWEDGGESVGSVANTARWPGVHPHWLFYVPVRDVEAVADRVREGAGRAMTPVTMADGARLCACEDPQGAAFGIFDAPP